MEPRRSVVLVSGGLDSAVALAWARAQGWQATALSFDYGQRHRAEIVAAAAVAEALGAARHVVVGLDLSPIGGSALTDTAIDVPKGRPGAGAPQAEAREAQVVGIPVTYVPARNMTFLSVAVGLAETLPGGAESAAVVIGVNALDYSGYPDCRPEFIAAFGEAARLGTKTGVEGRPVEIVAPLVSMTKAQIITLGAELGVDFSMTLSCYDPVEPPEGGGGPRACGRCDSCVIRARGFRDAGVPDTTWYAAQ